jgi:hypothetical protein
MGDFPLRANYDDIADVLYVTVGVGTPARYEEDEDGLVWRMNVSGVLYGVTIFDYAEVWAARSRLLADRIATRLHVPTESAREALRQT